MEPITCPHPTCGYQWTPRKENPRKCPQCMNPLWKSPRPKKVGRTITTVSLTELANFPEEPECVQAPEEPTKVKDSLSAAKAKAEELMRRLTA